MCVENGNYMHMCTVISSHCSTHPFWGGGGVFIGSKGFIEILLGHSAKVSRLEDFFFWSSARSLCLISQTDDKAQNNIQPFGCHL